MARHSPRLNSWERYFLGDIFNLRNLWVRQECAFEAILIKAERGDT